MSKHTSLKFPVKICKRCKRRKPMREYFIYSDGTADSLCMSCQKSSVTHYFLAPTNEDIPERGGELLAALKLREEGIYVTAGKDAGFKHVDLVAWGCILIEVKTSTRNEKGYLFGFNSSKKGLERDRSHFILLICLDDVPSYHLFPSDHPVFYHSDEKAKTKIAFLPDSTHRHQGSMTPELMAEYHERWELIGKKRREISQHLDKQLISQVSKTMEKRQMYYIKENTNVLGDWIIKH